MEKTINFRLTKDEKPDRSCRVLVFMMARYFTIIEYSLLHQKFNATDEEFGSAFNDVEVTAWAYMDEVLKEMGEN